MSAKPANKTKRDGDLEDENKRTARDDDDDLEGEDEDEDEEAEDDEAEDEDDEAEDEEDEDEEDEDEDEEAEDEEAEDDEDEDEEDEDEEDEDEDEDEAEPAEQDDPQWWVPYAVLGLLVLVGLLGFFGFFNNMLGSLAAQPAGADSAEAADTAHAAAPHAAPKPAPSARQHAGPPPMGAKRILVQYQGAKDAQPTVTRSKDEAKARAAEALAKLRKGDKFDDLVKEYSDEPNAAARRGNMGRFRKGAIEPALETAVEKLKVGDLSEVVETAKGFHILQRTL